MGSVCPETCGLDSLVFGEFEVLRNIPDSGYAAFEKVKLFVSDPV